MQFADIVLDSSDPPKLAEFWAAATGRSVAFSNADFALLAANESYPEMHIMKVPEVKTVKNRVHADYATPDRVADVARLVGLGATEQGTHEQGGLEWTVMADPEGNEF